MSANDLSFLKTSAGSLLSLVILVNPKYTVLYCTLSKYGFNLHCGAPFCLFCILCFVVWDSKALLWYFPPLLLDSTLGAHHRTVIPSLLLLITSATKKGVLVSLAHLMMQKLDVSSLLLWFTIKQGSKLYVHSGHYPCAHSQLWQAVLVRIQSLWKLFLAEICKVSGSMRIEKYIPLFVHR